MYNYEVPSLNKSFLCVINRENIELAAVISSYFAVSGEYLSVFDFPFVSAPKPEDVNFSDNIDIHALSRQRAVELSAYINNVQARVGTYENILLVGLTDEQKSFLNFVEGSNIIDLNTIDEISFQLDPFLPNEKGKFSCKKSDVLYGLSQAIKTNCILQFDENVETIDYSFNDREGLVIIENVDNISGVIAINYATAIGADVYIVPSIEQTEGQIALTIQLWKSGDNTAYETLEELVKSRLGGLDLSVFRFITFFTEGLPYSVIIGNHLPLSYVHLRKRPDHFIINNIIAENVKQFGSAVIFSPEKFDQEEVNDLDSIFASKKVIVKKINGKQATSRNLSRSIEFYPYDIYHIVSHGGQVSGSTIEQIFIDDNGTEHTVVYDFILGLAPGDIDDKIEVTEIIYPRKLNGLDFHSEDRKAQNYPHELFITMYRAIFERPKDKMKTLNENKVIVDSSGITCADFTFHGLIQYLAGDGIPFIFNNTCWSWSRMADSFLSIGCRGYIGTCWRIDNKVAISCATSFYQYSFEIPICQALFIASKNAGGTESEDIYVYWGLHFSTLKNADSLEESRANVYQNLEKGKEVWKRKLAENLSENQKITIKNIIYWLADEIKNNFNNSDFEKLFKKFLGKMG
ncbi:hypothetical protein [Pedobacter antarcticus]|uniref:hypothetical protein n=1 Tax=Pedobacter antarcticus TaxID=34086 RepID=UPI002930DB5D|nr:hypothetical protein [Pedobacter antarcticus]